MGDEEGYDMLELPLVDLRRQRDEMVPYHCQQLLEIGQEYML